MDDLQGKSLERLRIAVQAAFNDWKDREDVETGTMLTNFLLISHAQGFNAEGQPVTQTLVAPDGSLELMMGLVDTARIRFEMEYRSLFVPDQGPGD